MRPKEKDVYSNMFWIKTNKGLGRTKEVSWQVKVPGDWPFWWLWYKPSFAQVWIYPRIAPTFSQSQMRFWLCQETSGVSNQYPWKRIALHKPYHQLTQVSAECCRSVSKGSVSPHSHTGDSTQFTLAYISRAQGICICVLHSYRYLLVSSTCVWIKHCPPPQDKLTPPEFWLCWKKSFFLH